jgi:hypothetical protein
MGIGVLREGILKGGLNNEAGISLHILRDRDTAKHLLYPFGNGGGRIRFRCPFPLVMDEGAVQGY